MPFDKIPNLFNPRGSEGPEHRIQKDVMAMLRAKGWFVISTHGNTYQIGFPDLFCCHSTYGHRWVEIKNPNNYKFTPAQLENFPKLCANGSGVWIMVADTESEYQVLFRSPNWWSYTLAFKEIKHYDK